MKLQIAASVIIVGLLLAMPAAAQQAAETPTHTPTSSDTPAAATPTQTAAPADTPVSTETPAPPETPAPTQTATAQQSAETPTPAATATPTGTNTPTGTPTAVWPTDTATPIGATPTPTAPATVEDSSTPTATPDCREPGEPDNNDRGHGAVLVMDQPLTDLSLTPQEDVDFFLLWTKAGQLYQVTTGSQAGVDTRLRLYDPTGALIAENDDYKSGSAASQLTFQAAVEGWYELSVTSSAPLDWGCRRYTIVGVSIDATPTPTASASPTPKPTTAPSATAPPTAVPEHIRPDEYEPNNDFEQAANLGVGQTAALNLNAWPPGNNGVDNDFFRIYVKEQDDLLIETTELANGLDTNVIIYKEDGSVAAGNDDCHQNERRSCLTWQPGYTGLAFVLAGPVGTIPDAVTAGSRAYKLSITHAEAQGDGPSASGWGWSQETGGSRVTPAASSDSHLYGQPLPWKVTPLPATATPQAIEHPLSPAISQTVEAGQLAGGVVQVRSYSLAPPPPTPKSLQPLNIEVTIYYDENNNRGPDVSEGIAGVSVRVLDATSNRLLAQTFTGSQGHAMLSLSAAGRVRLSISYLGYTKEIRPPGGIFQVRLPALHVPSLIP